jgi:hypothetical protein
MSIIGAPPSVIGQIDSALDQTNTALTAAIAEAEAYMAAEPGVAGMVAGVADPEVFFGYMAVASQDANLIAMQAFVVRMQANLQLGAV